MLGGRRAAQVEPRIVRPGAPGCVFGFVSVGAAAPMSTA
jgi:hypothetical protein